MASHCVDVRIAAWRFCEVLTSVGAHHDEEVWKIRNNGAKVGLSDALGVAVPL
jgi:hypothetical protein